jgi:hypothetical protein
MLEAVHGINLSSNVEFPSSLIKVLDSWVVLISSKNLLGLDSPTTWLDCVYL